MMVTMIEYMVNVNVNDAVFSKVELNSTKDAEKIEPQWNQSLIKIVKLATFFAYIIEFDFINY